MSNSMCRKSITIDAIVVGDDYCGCIVDSENGCLFIEPHSFSVGQRLKIQIVKEDDVKEDAIL